VAEEVKPILVPPLFQREFRQNFERTKVKKPLPMVQSSLNEVLYLFLLELLAKALSDYG
jgi:hypothetical protein